jgi:hypothetical protein
MLPPFHVIGGMHSYSRLTCNIRSNQGYDFRLADHAVHAFVCMCDQVLLDSHQSRVSAKNAIPPERHHSLMHVLMLPLQGQWFLNQPMARCP